MLSPTSVKQRCRYNRCSRDRNSLQRFGEARVGISTDGDGSIFEKGPGASPESTVGSFGRSVTVPFMVTLELTSDSGTTARPGLAENELVASPLDASAVDHESG